MFQFLRTSVQFIAPVFVICTMLHVGLTQKPSAIAVHLKNWPFLLKMLAANFIFAPLLMVGALYLVPFNPALKAGLLIFSLGAGAPFLIKLTQTAEHDLALGGGNDAADDRNGHLCATRPATGALRCQRERTGHRPRAVAADAFADRGRDAGRPTPAGPK